MSSIISLSLLLYILSVYWSNLSHIYPIFLLKHLKIIYNFQLSHTIKNDKTKKIGFVASKNVHEGTWKLRRYIIKSQLLFNGKIMKSILSILTSCIFHTFLRILYILSNSTAHILLGLLQHFRCFNGHDNGVISIIALAELTGLHFKDNPFDIHSFLICMSAVTIMNSPVGCHNLSNLPDFSFVSTMSPWKSFLIFS